MPPCFTAPWQARKPSVCTWPAKATPRTCAGTSRPASPNSCRVRVPEVVAGDVLDSILAVATAHHSDLILLGHSSGRRRRSLARRLSMKAPCSVWIAPGQAQPSINRVLVPFDFSPISADTVSVATALAEAAGLDECLALHVEFNQAVVTFDEMDEIVAEDRDRAFGLFIAPINLHGVWVKPLFVDSPNVAQTIVRIAVEQALRPHRDGNSRPQPFGRGAVGQRDRALPDGHSCSVAGGQALWRAPFAFAGIARPTRSQTATSALRELYRRELRPLTVIWAIL